MMRGYTNCNTPNSGVKCPQCGRMHNQQAASARPCMARPVAAEVVECGGPISAATRKSFGTCSADEPKTCFD
ncbi:MAG: hypothetical protein VB100_14385 [Angelakisella sp.]|nr:hypothetical protein [Angelakisella sp.]